MGIIEKIRNAYTGIEEILAECMVWKRQFSGNVAYAAERIGRIYSMPTNKFLSEGLREAGDLSDYVRDSYNSLKAKAHGIISKIGGLYENRTLNKINIGNSYSTNIKYLGSSYKKTEIASILSGKKGWRWSERKTMLLHYINSNRLEESEKSLIRTTIESSTYLRRKHGDLYRSLVEAVR